MTEGLAAGSFCKGTPISNTRNIGVQVTNLNAIENLNRIKVFLIPSVEGGCVEIPWNHLSYLSQKRD
jgi:hypothetical protein